MNREPLLPVTEGEARAFRDDGAVCLRRVLDMDWIEALRRAVDDDIASPGPMVRLNTPAGNPGRFFVDFQLWQRQPACCAAALQSPMPAIAAQLLGATRVNWYHDHLLVKEPGTMERTPWHHDFPYYPLQTTGELDGVASFWVPLDPVSRDTAVEYVRGSHKWGKRYAPKFFRKDAGFDSGAMAVEEAPDIDAQRDRYDLLGWDLEPGDMIAFTGLTLHGAPGNGSLVRRRRAWVLRYLGDNVRWSTRPGAVSPPIEGHGLKDGDRIGGALFPEVWPATGAG